MKTKTRLPGVRGPLYGACEKLFTNYPLAVEPVTSGGTRVRMELALREDAEMTFWTLQWVKSGQPLPFFTVRPWRDLDQGVVIEANDEIEEQGALRLEKAEQVITCGVPLPADGSMFGWKGASSAVAALIPFYGDPETDEEAAFSVMPLAGAPASGWPPFTGESLFGSWFWEHLQAGRIVNLAALIGKTQRMAFWVRSSIPGAGDGVVAVKADLDSGEGFILPRGRYVYWKALRAPAPVPPLAGLLADPGKTDLGPRFRRR